MAIHATATTVLRQALELVKQAEEQCTLEIVSYLLQSATVALECYIVHQWRSLRLMKQ